MSGLVKCGVCGYTLSFERKTDYITIREYRHMEDGIIICENKGGDSRLASLNLKKRLK
ncbi:hypothetical protein [Aneurinibacillus migulanus]|uniref:hypothetical protein n=1 Tax=Aneurinibacillus migulanus TaxID=47500 RepID=UPI0038990438